MDLEAAGTIEVCFFKWKLAWRRLPCKSLTHDMDILSTRQVNCDLCMHTEENGQCAVIDSLFARHHWTSLNNCLKADFIPDSLPALVASLTKAQVEEGVKFDHVYMASMIWFARSQRLLFQQQTFFSTKRNHQDGIQAS